MIFGHGGTDLVLRAALRGGVRGAGVARAEGVPQHARVRQRRVRAAAVVGGPAVPLPTNEAQYKWLKRRHYNMCSVRKIVGPEIAVYELL